MVYSKNEGKCEELIMPLPWRTSSLTMLLSARFMPENPLYLNPRKSMRVISKKPLNVINRRQDEEEKQKTGREGRLRFDK